MRLDTVQGFIHVAAAMRDRMARMEVECDEGRERTRVLSDMVDRAIRDLVAAEKERDQAQTLAARLTDERDRALEAGSILVRTLRRIIAALDLPPEGGPTALEAIARLRERAERGDAAAAYVEGVRAADGALGALPRTAQPRSPYPLDREADIWWMRGWQCVEWELRAKDAWRELERARAEVARLREHAERMAFSYTCTDGTCPADRDECSACPIAPYRRDYPVVI
jgi:hypothetical protein